VAVRWRGSWRLLLRLRLPGGGRMRRRPDATTSEPPGSVRRLRLRGEAEEFEEAVRTLRENGMCGRCTSGGV
jgi:hypothetical protein